MPRTARLDAPGVLHHVIIRGIERRHIFKDDKDRDDFLVRIEGLLPEMNIVCYAWALMSNHSHFLFRTGDVPLSTLMRRLLTGYVVRFNRRHRRHGQTVSKPLQVIHLPGGCVPKGTGTLHPFESPEGEDR